MSKLKGAATPAEIIPLQDEWDEKEFRLLLIYKDGIGEEKISGSPLVSDSRTISLHLVAAGKQESGSTLQRWFFDPTGNERHKTPVPDDCCVWGWWRKPWERHHSLFARLKLALERGKRPTVFLYNQYLRRLFEAKLHDIYFEPFLTSVIVPATWKDKCPIYYSKKPHWCGAFFVLEIETESNKPLKPKERNASILEDFLVDSSSFDDESPETPTIIPAPDGIDYFCRRIIDSPPGRASVRTCENTVLCLRHFKQRERTSKLLQMLALSDIMLAEAFLQTSWQDLLEVLRSADALAWSKLGECREAIAVLGRKAREAGAVITRYDFELFSSACSSSELRELITVQTDGKLKFDDLGNALLKWVTSVGEREARIAASLVFKKAWDKARQRYNLGVLPETYFDNLPSIEAIACAVRHEIGEKFYRDHLSHNVRAALLTAHLIKTIALTNDINNCCVGFFSGLYHDFTMPLTTFPDTVGQLAKALASAQPCDDENGIHQTHFQSPLDRNLLRRQLSYVALLASIPNASDAFKSRPFEPWDDLDSILTSANKRILFEELLCASTDEHALISAAIFLDYAVRGRMTGKVGYDSAFRSLVNDMASPQASREGKEIVAILQCMALHDRRPAAEHHAVSDPPRDTPMPLNCSDFQTAVNRFNCG